MSNLAEKHAVCMIMVSQIRWSLSGSTGVCYFMMHCIGVFVDQLGSGSQFTGVFTRKDLVV